MDRLGTFLVLLVVVVGVYVPTRGTLFELHPSSILAAVTACAGSAARWSMPPGRLVLSWAALGALSNAVLWPALAGLFGWRFGGLGGALYLSVALPLNGFITGFCAAPAVHRLLPGGARRSVKTAAGWAILAALLFANFVYLTEVRGDRPTP